MRDPVRGASRSALLAALLALVSPSATASGADVPAVEPRLGPLVARTVERAAVRFADPRCSSVLADFEDSRSGRPLAEVLTARGHSPSAFLGSLRFVDADGMVQCRRRAAWAWVPVGGNVVFVCRSRFAELARKDAWLAEDVLIHEALHSLGLGENPPSSEEITRTVVRRCGK